MTYQKIYRPDLAGKQYYPNYRLDKNISWHNVYTYPMGIIYSLITFEWIKKGISWRLKPVKIWLPPHYSKDYYQIKNK